MTGKAAIHGWLLLLPAAVLLVAFPHYPAVATIVHSCFSTARAARAAEFIGLDNYRDMMDDPIFWQALRNNAVFCLFTIPASIALALLMAVWVNGKIGGRGFLRLSFFFPTILPVIAVAHFLAFFYNAGSWLGESTGATIHCRGDTC